MGKQTDTLLTPLPGGHVFAGTWEALAALGAATCEACGEYVKLDGKLVPPKERDGAGVEQDLLCGGWGEAPPDALPRVVLGLIREAPDEQPNGPTEKAIEALHAAHLHMLDTVLPLVRMFPEAQGALRAEGNAIGALVGNLADDSRALRLAYEATCRPVERTPEVVLRAMLAESLKAWSDFEVEFYRVPDGSKEEEDAYERGHAALTRVYALQSALGFVLAGKDADMDPDLRADYLARLNGSTPLDAPPAEAP